ncbi:hypothetical protein MCOR07_001422 [Pyricularia oryzae]|nr:hypothetical protein MCOR22_004594 [Pyricularia oryzae]KAI6628462.1 hypothetical protein MCOR07_001422 [Pyricularia oryzae]
MGASKYNLSPDQQYWWQFVEPSLSSMLEYAGQYTPEEQDSHMEWYATQVTPIFGIQPSEEAPDPNPFTHDSSPCHISINWCSKGKPTVRSGMTRPHDVFNSQAFVDELQPAMETSDQPDRAIFDGLAKSLFLKDPQEIAKVKAVVPPHLHTRIPNIGIAWDLVGAKRKLKLYHNPQAKKLATSRTGNDIVVSSIRALANDGYNYNEAMDVLERYVTELNPEKLELIIIGMDAAEPALPTTRIKPYGIVAEANSWETVKNIYTLGGQVLNQERKQGLDILRSIWDLMRCHRGQRLADDYHMPKNDSSSTRGVLTPSFEVKPGQSLPDVKVYVSQWQFAKTDREIAECTVEIFKRLGWQKEADSYFNLLQKAFPYADLDGPPAIHEYISFAYNDTKGPGQSCWFDLQSGSESEVRVNSEKFSISPRTEIASDCHRAPRAFVDKHRDPRTHGDPFSHYKCHAAGRICRSEAERRRQSCDRNWSSPENPIAFGAGVLSRFPFPRCAYQAWQPPGHGSGVGPYKDRQRVAVRGAQLHGHPKKRFRYDNVPRSLTWGCARIFICTSSGKRRWCPNCRRNPMWKPTSTGSDLEK